MAKNTKPESTGPGGDSLRATSSQFRMAAGLDERTSDKPTDPADIGPRTIRREPEGGYGGNGESEEPATAEDVVDENGLTGGETATEVARVTGEDVVDVKPAAAPVEDGDDGDEEE